MLFGRVNLLQVTFVVVLLFQVLERVLRNLASLFFTFDVLYTQVLGQKLQVLGFIALKLLFSSVLLLEKNGDAGRWVCRFVGIFFLESAQIVDVTGITR